MRNIFTLLLFLAVFTANAQTKDAPFFKKVEALMKKAEGQKFVDILGNDNKVGKQIFSYDLVSVEKKRSGKYSRDWLYDHTNIDWSKLRYFSGGAPGNDKLNVMTIRLEEDCDLDQHVKGEKGDGTRKVGSIDIYFLSKDYDAMHALFDGQYR